MAQIADRNRVLKRVTEILNLCDGGTYSATVSARNKTRNQAAILDFTIEAGIDILRTIAETPNEFKQSLISVVPLTHGDPIPEHVGRPAFVEIERYTGAGYTPAMQRDYRKIDSYRRNPSKAYDDKDHDAAGSTLAGYYDFWEGKAYFTGEAARAGLIVISRDDTATKIPIIFEPIWVQLAVGNSAKVGDGNYSQSIAGAYGQRGLQQLAEFTAGRRGFPEVTDPEPTSSIHN